VDGFEGMTKELLLPDTGGLPGRDRLGVLVFGL
jgi:hypothetical protein